MLKREVERLTSLIAIFENKALDFSKNRAEGDNILGDAYEYLMRLFATESGTSKGQFYTPVEVSRIMAKIIGIRVERVKTLTWVLVGGVAGVAGALWGIYYGVHPLTGWMAILSVFAASILGGMSSFAGTILGAYVVAFSENTVMQALNAYVGLDFSFKPAIPFIIIILVLLALPFVAGEGEKSWKRRPIAVLLILLAGVALSTLTHLGEHTPWSPVMDAWSSQPIPAEYLKARTPLEHQGFQALFREVKRGDQRVVASSDNHDFASGGHDQRFPFPVSFKISSAARWPEAPMIPPPG